MPRGGRREGSGRKSTWKSGCSFSETKLIRVPARIADKVLEFAHKLDADEVSDLETHSNDSGKAANLIDVSPPSHDSVVPGQLLLFSPDQAMQDTQAPELQPPKPLSGMALAARFNISRGTLHKQRVKYSALTFLAWSASKDPEGWAWEYDAETKLYYPTLLEF